MPPTLEVPAGAGPGEEITHVPASSLRYRGGKHGSEKPVQLDRPGTLPEHHSSHAVGHSSEGSSKDFDMIQKMIRRARDGGHVQEWVRATLEAKVEDVPHVVVNASVDIRTSIADVLAKFLVQRNIRIKDFADVNEQQPVWSRHRFFSALLHLSDALELMFSEKVDELAIQSTDGRAVSMVQFEGIMRWVHEHQNSHTSGGGAEEVAGIDVRAKLGDIVNKDNRRHDHMEGADDEELHTLTKAEHARLGQQNMIQKRMSPLRTMALEWVASPWTEMLIMLLLVIDVLIESVDIYFWIIGEKHPGADLADRMIGDQSILQGLMQGFVDPQTAITGTILLIFGFEAMVRIYGLRYLLVDGSHLLDTVDVLVIIASVVMYIMTFMGLTAEEARMVNFARLLRLLRAIKLARSLRKLVGSNKRRYQKDGFDLDLTYVTPSCIAMSLPAEGGEANYRNSLEDVARFFRVKHPELFHIFNLCSERSYDASHFNGRVTRIKTDDHNPPLLSDLVTFVEQANQFLGEPEPHVIAVHCLGGKGRTGVFVCAWLMYSCFSDTAQGAMTHFSKKRTGGQAKAVQGVSGASQRRYLHYFQQALEFGGYRTSRIFINKIVLHTCPHMDPDGGCDPWFTIEQNGEFIYNSKDSIGVSNFSAEEQSFEMDLGRVALMGDIRIVFYDNDLVPPRDELMCFTWFHTGFVGRTHVTIPKAEVDMACSDRKNKVFDENFAISLHFEEIPEELEFTRAQSDRSGGSQDSEGQAAETFSKKKTFNKSMAHILKAVGGTFSWRRRSSATGSPASPLAALRGLTKSGSSSKSKQSPNSPTGDATASSRSIGAHADSGRKTAVQFQQSSVQDHSELEQTGGALGDCAEESESVSGSHESPTSLSTGQNPDHGAPSSTLSSPHESVLVWSRFVAGADFGSKEEDGESITAGGLQSSEDRSPIQQLSSDEYDGEVMSPVPKDGSSIKTKKKRGLKAGMGSLARAMSTRLRRQSGKEGTRKGSVEHSFQGDIEELMDITSNERAAFLASSGEGSTERAWLGPWRAIEAPSLRVLEQARRFKGRMLESDKVGFWTMQTPDFGKGHTALEPLPNSLSPGPAVSHSGVSLYRVSDTSLFSDLPNHSEARNLVRYYQRGGSGVHFGISKLARKAVSLNKRRFQEAGFDLDLTYITPRIIAMGYPASGFEGYFRNPADEVYRFFQERHAGHFRIVNLVAERDYDLEMFHGSVARYPFCDHNPPAMELLLPCCSHIHAFLHDSPDNTVAVHCKAGKGRTGLIIVCYLVYAGLAMNMRAARSWYDTYRTTNGKGLTIISQIRYAHYFAELLRRVHVGVECPTTQSAAPAVRLHAAIVRTSPAGEGKGQLFLTAGVRSDKDFDEHELFSSRSVATGPAVASAHWGARFGTGPFHEDPEEGLRVAGDIHVGLHVGGNWGNSKRICHLWIHSSFLVAPPSEMCGTVRRLAGEDALSAELAEAGLHREVKGTQRHRPPRGHEVYALTLERHEIDGAATGKDFPEDFAITVFFESIPDEVGTGAALENAERFARRRKHGADAADLARKLYQDKIEYLMLKQEQTSAHSKHEHQTTIPITRMSSSERRAATEELPSYEEWLTKSNRMAPVWDMDTVRQAVSQLHIINEIPVKHRQTNHWSSKMHGSTRNMQLLSRGMSSRSSSHTNVAALASVPDDWEPRRDPDSKALVMHPIREASVAGGEPSYEGGTRYLRPPSTVYENETLRNSTDILPDGGEIAGSCSAPEDHIGEGCGADAWQHDAERVKRLSEGEVDEADAAPPGSHGTQMKGTPMACKPREVVLQVEEPRAGSEDEGGGVVRVGTAASALRSLTRLEARSAIYDPTAVEEGRPPE